MNIRRKTRLPLLVLAAIVCFLIVCPLIMIFAKAVITDGRLDFYCAWQTLTESENAVMIGNSLLLGVLVVLLSTLIAAPLAYLFSRTCFARYRAFDIIFMIPFMTPPYIASMGWILFMQKRGLLQQLFPGAAGCENWFFSLGGLVLVMSLHVFPFMLTMLKNAMLNIPSSLEESGAVFGAGFWQRMRKIFLRLALAAGGKAVMTGTAERGSYSAQLLEAGQMEMLRYPVHLNKAQMDALADENSFSKVIAYHSPEIPSEGVYRV